MINYILFNIIAWYCTAPTLKEHIKSISAPRTPTQKSQRVTPRNLYYNPL